jgi:hypothetical protein
MKGAKEMAKRILSNYPDYGKASPEYLLAFAEYLAGLSFGELEIVINPRTGVAARCKFLPSIADIVDCLKAEADRLEEERNRKNQFKSAHTTYRRFDFDNDPPMPPPETRKEQVMRELGYDPEDNRGKYKPSAEEVAAATAAVERMDEAVAQGKPPPLKTPPRPASKYLKALLARQDAGETYLR